MLEDTFLELNLGACPKLRVFEARIETSSYAFENLMSWLARVLSTVTSPVFSRLILSLAETTLEPHALQVTRETTGIQVLDQRVSWLSSRSRLRFIIKSDLPPLWRQLLEHWFPCSTGAGAIRFVYADSGTVPQCGRGR